MKEVSSKICSTGAKITHYESYIKGFTINAALKKQAEQLDFYCKNLSPEKSKIIRERIAAKTCIPVEIDRDAEISVTLINRYVPRGADIEYIRDSII